MDREPSADPAAASANLAAALADPAAASADPAAALERARGVAWRALNRRDRTVAELRGVLARREVDAEVAEQVLAELCELGYLDDAGYALRFAEDRRRLDGWGAERIARRLRELGVADEHVEAAAARRAAGDELDAAVALLERRFRTAPATRQERDRALGVLLRKGYAPEVALDALRCHAARRAA